MTGPDLAAWRTENEGGPMTQTRKTPHGLHLYRATLPRVGPYGWGNTPAAARARFAENLLSYTPRIGTKAGRE